MEVNITTLISNIKNIKYLILEPENFSNNYLKVKPLGLLKLAILFILVRVVALYFNQSFYGTLPPEWIDNAFLSTTLDSLIFFLIFAIVSIVISGIYYFVLLFSKHKLKYRQWLFEYTYLGMFTFIFTRLGVLGVACVDLIFTDNNLARNTSTGLLVDFVAISFAAWMGIYLSKLVAKQVKITEAWSMALTISYLIIHLVVFGP